MQVSLAVCYNPQGVSSMLALYMQRLDIVLPFLRALICLRDESFLQDFVNPKMTISVPPVSLLISPLFPPTHFLTILTSSLPRQRYPPAPQEPMPQG